jgi:hypothetical protein
LFGLEPTSQKTFHGGDETLRIISRQSALTTFPEDHALVPYGRLDNAEWLEPLARDYPDFGVGGGTQLLLDHKEVLLDEVYDTVLQRNLTILEIQNLGGL